MKKVLILVILALLIGVFIQFCLGIRPKNLPLPEKPGLYEVPGRPELKLRFFIHP